ncbi:MAG TPA: nitroreductase family protein [Bacteroidales bacterium]|nr:nitroreductase family protein [Bacteroidales bacterium]HPF02067.1 nitroreductase family protein [Bacteroidales bacterium]HPJ60027.1 nitroreductase family protein [Bacteroidales bacterium]HPR11446.1 nitroreductase family protein [Bacteroidales bacterium]HRW86129.1 nitroreductase family protein [Bacteroidales bacterium]
MEYYDLIRTRESLRSYDPDRPVSREILERIIEAGRLAPSAANRQPWRFVVISSEPMLHKVRACYHREWFKEAPHILVVIGLKDQAWTRNYDGYNSVETDVAIAMTHLVLAAQNEGVGTCWIAAFDPGQLREALGLRKDQVVFGITPLGYPKPGYQKSTLKNRKPKDEIAEYL